MSDLMRLRGLLMCYDWMNLLVNWSIRRSEMTLVVMAGTILMGCFFLHFGGLERRLGSFTRSRFLFWVMSRSRLLQLFKRYGILLVVMRHGMMQDSVMPQGVMFDGKMRNNFMRHRSMCH